MLLDRLTSSIDPTGRDLNRDCGYIDNPTVWDYLELFKRADVANRVVSIWGDECWAAYPDLYETDRPKETEFEKAWKTLSLKVHPWHYLHRLDVRSGIGEFGVMLLGLADGGNLTRPAATYNLDGTLRSNSQSVNQLLYLRVFDQSQVTVDEVEGNASNARFGQPVYYNVNFYDPNLLSQTAGETFQGGGGMPGITRKVHWTRVIHAAEGGEVTAPPRMEPVLNRLMDIRKVAGSSAEMFYKGGFPGYQFVTNQDLVDMTDTDVEAIQADIEDYYNGLKRYLSAERGEWKSLAPQVADPEKNLMQQLTLLCATIGVPMRVFLGTESGHLASTQDAGTWKERLRGRQLNYLEPMLVRPFVDRLMDLGCLPRVPDYVITWRDLQTLGDKDLADVALKKVQALMQYVTGGVFAIMPPKMLFTLILGYTDRQSDAIITELGGDEAVRKKLEKMWKDSKVKAQPQGGGRFGAPNANDPGRPPGPPTSNL